MEGSWAGDSRGMIILIIILMILHRFFFFREKQTSGSVTQTSGTHRQVVSPKQTIVTSRTAPGANPVLDDSFLVD